MATSTRSTKSTTGIAAHGSGTYGTVDVTPPELNWTKNSDMPESTTATRDSACGSDRGRRRGDSGWRSSRSTDRRDRCTVASDRMDRPRSRNLVTRRAERDPRRPRAVALLNEKVPAGTEHARGAAEETIGVREVVDHVVGDQDVDARVRVRQLLRVDDASCLRSRLGEALAKEELQVRPGTLLVLVAGALRIAGVANEHRL